MEQVRVPRSELTQRLRDEIKSYQPPAREPRS